MLSKNEGISWGIICARLMLMILILVVAGYLIDSSPIFWGVFLMIFVNNLENRNRK